MNVTLISGINTNYSCSYANGHYSILNIINSKIFTIQGGILKYGNGNLNYYFIIVRDGSLCLSHMKIEFVSAMNSMVFILGGKVILENMEVNNQLDTTWVSPLVLSHSNTSSVTINLYSCTIINSMFENANPSYIKSAIIYFINETSATQSIIFNISFCLCLNNTFNLNNYSSCGGFSFLCSYNTYSSMFFFYKNFKI
jgi:hypothetical protein